ncbi:hypothetical protein Y032_0410g949 [Ancylostoma ceylanicum]|uniref:Uncharacterized protein n=1 Tax=Ancylostoma ceylanicum TaxID=53326 RepID=A0A016X3F9_9BILA|nr:hypothetical protein Y032_0410g949 [Ancylostoma ceylanicum]
MRFFSFALIFALFVFVAMAKPRGPPEGILLYYTRFVPNVYSMVTRETRGHNDKAPQKTRSSYIRFGKRANPNADLLYLDQLIL